MSSGSRVSGAKRLTFGAGELLNRGAIYIGRPLLRTAAALCCRGGAAAKVRASTLSPGDAPSRFQGRARGQVLASQPSVASCRRWTQTVSY